MRVLALAVSLLASCGDNVVVDDAGDRIESEDLGACCRLLVPHLLDVGQAADDVRACVARKTAPEVCRRIDCVVFDEWICPGGVTAEQTRARADGVTECMCGGRWP